MTHTHTHTLSHIASTIGNMFACALRQRCRAADPSRRPRRSAAGAAHPELGGVCLRAPGRSLIILDCQARKRINSLAAGSPWLKCLTEYSCRVGAANAPSMACSSSSACCSSSSRRGAEEVAAAALAEGEGAAARLHRSKTRWLRLHWPKARWLRLHRPKARGLRLHRPKARGLQLHRPKASGLLLYRPNTSARLCVTSSVHCA